MSDCPCPSPTEPCEAYGGMILGHLRWKICRGEILTPELCEEYRYFWRTGKQPFRKSTQRPKCVHLGDATGERRQCPTCTGKVEIKLLACAVHDRCTTHKAIDGVACCATCKDYHTPEESS